MRERQHDALPWKSVPMHSKSPLRRFATKALFRFVDSSPMLQRRLIDLA
jgi:hypothetical protein